MKTTTLLLFGALLFAPGYNLIAAEVAQPLPQWTHEQSGLVFTQLPAGCFAMGHDEVQTLENVDALELPAETESPRHRVCVDEFWLGTYEVTQAAWQSIMGDSTAYPQDPSRPVNNISRQEIAHFIDRINGASSEFSFRLPTEAEWEYACRAGKDSTPWPAYLTPEERSHFHKSAWFGGVQRQDATAEPVGQKLPNAWGLHDMLGNLWELTADDYVENGYRTHSEQNPTVNNGGERRTIRGGSYKSTRYYTRCGVRGYSLPNDPLPTVGFRLVRLTASSAAK